MGIVYYRIMSLETGSPAPAFSAPDQNGVTHTLDQYNGQWVLLYFYPKDDTPGCTKEACGFRDLWKEIQSTNCTVIGVSADSPESHTKFVGKFDLPFTLLADTKKEIVKTYGVWQEKSMYGKKYMGIARWSFLIDPDGNLAKIYEKVKPAEHPQQVLDDLVQLQS